MSRVASLVAALTLIAICGCGSEPPERTDEAKRAATSQERSAEATPFIRYLGMPHSVALDGPYEGTTTLDPETGLPRRGGVCVPLPGEEEQVAAHNAKVRAAYARGELREFQLKHKFMRTSELLDRFTKDEGTILAPGKPIES